MKPEPDGSIRMTGRDAINMVGEMTLHDVKRLSIPRTRVKMGKIVTKVYRRDTQTSAKGLSTMFRQEGYRTGPKAIESLTSLVQQPMGVNARQKRRWVRRALRPSKGMRAHIRNQKAARRRSQ
jgi:hypothetical protein